MTCFYFGCQDDTIMHLTRLKKDQGNEIVFPAFFWMLVSSVCEMGMAQWRSECSEGGMWNGGAD